MINQNGLLFLFSIFLVFFCVETVSKCKQLTSCSCIFSDGQGYNLLPLTMSNASFLTAIEGNSRFYFHPCTNMPLSNHNTSECRKGKGVSLCAEYQNQSFSLGTVEQTSVSVDSDNSKSPLLILQTKNHTSTIGLVCCNFCNSHLVVDPVVDSKEHHLLLVSPYACKTVMDAKSLSTGSILLIYFFVFTGLYFIGGAVTLKFLRGATGWEMVPNHKFWRELPSLVKEGIAFTFRGCTVNTYDTI